MTQLLDPQGPYACVWDEHLPCEITYMEFGRPATDQELMEFVFNNDFPPIAPVPIGSSGLLLGSAVIIALTYKRMLT